MASIAGRALLHDPAVAVGIAEREERVAEAKPTTPPHLSDKLFIQDGRDFLLGERLAIGIGSVDEVASKVVAWLRSTAVRQVFDIAPAGGHTFGPVHLLVVVAAQDIRSAS